MKNSVLAESAYDFILAQILEGEIQPGERIREDVIAEQMGTSRTPVREAVNQLTQNGFIVSIKRKGLYCVELSKQDLLDVLELRVVLERLSFQRCIEIADEEDIERLYTLIDIFKSYSPEERIENHNQADIAFHNTLAEITKFSRLRKYIGEVESIMLIARANLKKTAKVSEVIDTSWDLHRDFVKAIEIKCHDLFAKTSMAHMQLMKDTQILMD